MSTLSVSPVLAMMIIYRTFADRAPVPSDDEVRPLPVGRVHMKLSGSVPVILDVKSLSGVSQALRCFFSDRLEIERAQRSIRRSCIRSFRSHVVHVPFRCLASRISEIDIVSMIVWWVCSIFRRVSISIEQVRFSFFIRNYCSPMDIKSGKDLVLGIGTVKRVSAQRAFDRVFGQKNPP